MNLAAAILHLFPGADPLRDFTVVDHGQGQVIAIWSLQSPQPTNPELDAAWVAVQAKQAKQAEIEVSRADITTKFMALTPTVRGANLDGFYSILKALDDGYLDAARERIKTLPIDTVIPAKTATAVK